MENPTHPLNALFAQLGLPNSDADIAHFITQHRSLRDAGPLCDAAFWTPTQASFIRQAIKDDADWAGVVDQLDALLRH